MRFSRLLSRPSSQFDLEEDHGFRTALWRASALGREEVVEKR